jgi:hypothetical protein
MRRKDTLMIISGGQTGVDRAALDAALANGVPCGGWCPAGRKAEDGRVPEQYPLQELESADYRQRTIRNVQDSDATVIIHFGPLSGGTRLTLNTCNHEGVPYLLIDGAVVHIDEAVGQVSAFIDRLDIRVLNVAGPRASNNPDAWNYAFQVINSLLQNVGNHG